MLMCVLSLLADLNISPDPGPLHRYNKYWSERSACASTEVAIKLGIIGPSGVRAPAQRSGHYTRHYFLFLSLYLSFLSANQNPIRGYRRILNFCMGSEVTKKRKIPIKKKFGDHPYPPN